MKHHGTAQALPIVPPLEPRLAQILSEQEEREARVLSESGVGMSLDDVLLDIVATINHDARVGLGLVPNLGHPMPSTQDAAIVRELVDQIEERPFVFAVRFLNLERAVERLTKQPATSAERD